MVFPSECQRRARRVAEHPRRGGLGPSDVVRIVFEAFGFGNAEHLRGEQCIPSRAASDARKMCDAETRKLAKRTAQ